MAESAEELTESLAQLTQPGYREKLIARGLARGLIWRNGILPSDAPPFSPDLSTDLLDHGFLVFSQSLKLRELDRTNSMVATGLYVAAEAIESSSRHDRPDDPQRGFHLTMAAAAFHIGGYSARAFSLFGSQLSELNLSSAEQSLVHLMRRRLQGLRATSARWLNDPDNSDDGVVTRLESDTDFSVDDVVAMSLTRQFHRAIAAFEVALLSGREQYFELAVQLINEGLESAAEAQHVPLWWVFRISRHLFDDLWGNTLHNLLPKEGGPTEWPALRDRFIQFLSNGDVAQVDLWPSQVGAAKRIVDSEDDLVVALPTSAGKTRIAELCILRTLADGKRIIYVTPLRALSAQIEHGLADTFRPLGYSVTSVYGASGVAESDLETLVSANIVVATPEKVDFAIRQEPSLIDDVGLIVLDEGHMIGLSEREIRYEMLVQRLLKRSDASSRRIVCLSAVFSDGDAFDDFTAWLRSDEPGQAIRSTWRPTRQRPGVLTWQVPPARRPPLSDNEAAGYGKLSFRVEGEEPFVPRFVDSQPPTAPRRKYFPNDDQEFLVAAASSFLARGQTVLVYCPIKLSVEATAEAFLKAHSKGFFDSAADESRISELDDAVRIGEEYLGAEHPAVRCVKIGIAVHHGSLPRQFLGEIETLLRRRILPICICSPTLAQGLDLSFSALLFRSLYRSAALIKPKEFANVIGRVGRAFVDLDGLYVMPVFSTDRAVVRRRIREFDHLITQAQQRQLESGVYLLVRYIVQILAERLNVPESEIADYVLNEKSTWTVAAVDGDEHQLHEQLQIALNELDTAILGIVDTLEMPVEDVADYLDECLRSSYWERRVLRVSAESRDLQAKVLHGRAHWLWNHTDAQKRKAFFASGIGYRSGATIDERIDDLESLLQSAEDAIGSDDIEQGMPHLTELAEILLSIPTFQKQSPIVEWKHLLEEWIRGTALGQCADTEGVQFIQEDIVYRLVWAVEATRLHLAHARSKDDPPGATLAVCLTYGVPNRIAAILMQGGIRSRTLAVEISQQVGSVFNDRAGLLLWASMIRDGETEPPAFDSEEKIAEWNHFMERFEHRHIARWRQIDDVLAVKWTGTAPNKNTRVRITRDGESQKGTVSTIFFEPLGVVEIPDSIKSNHFFGLTQDKRAFIRLSFFGR